MAARVNARNVRRWPLSGAFSSKVSAAAYRPWLNSAIPFCSESSWAPRASNAETRTMELMTRIIDHQIQLPETMTLLAFKKAEAEQRRDPGCDLRPRGEPFGRRDRDLQYTARFHHSFDQQSV